MVEVVLSIREGAMKLLAWVIGSVVADQEKQNCGEYSEKNYRWGEPGGDSPATNCGRQFSRGIGPTDWTK